MGSLAYLPKFAEPARWAQELGVSREAVDVYLASDVIDLHLDTFIWQRIFGWSMGGPNGRGILGARLFKQVDFARIREARVTGATWVITTNPLRNAEDRARAFVENIANLRATLEAHADEMALVRNTAEYHAARAQGRHGAFIGIQGGNALDRDEDALDLIPDDVVVRITLVHLTGARIGASSAPLGGLFGEGLSDFGKGYVRRMNEKNILVDLAHISKKGFWDAVAVHDKSKPIVVTHTGVEGVNPHWRNIDDDQLRAIAGSGGTVGIMYHQPYIAPSFRERGVAAVAAHIAHAVKVIGDEHVSLGSDWDGFILPPRDMPTCSELPVLVEHLLKRGLRPESVQKVLGQNFLRVVAALRG
jgi:membrane dipeptidase